MIGIVGARFSELPCPQRCMSYVTRTVLLLVALLVGVGCSVQSPTAVNRESAAGRTATPPGAASTPVPVEADDASLRTACATRVLGEFIRAFNSGDAVALERTVGSGPLGAQGFQWISFHDGLRRDAQYTAEGARKMLLERWSRGQRLTLTRVEAGAGPSWHGGVDASLWLESRAPSVAGVAPIFGKTALSCVGGRVYVLSIGDE